jgi:hypothetical protein
VASVNRLSPCFELQCKKNHILDLVCVVPILCCDLGSVSVRPSSHDSHFAILLLRLYLDLISLDFYFGAANISFTAPGFDWG